MKRLITSGIIFILFSSCSSEQYIVQYNGNNVIITLASKAMLEGELISVSEDEIMVLISRNVGSKYQSRELKKLASVKTNSIKSVEVQNYTGNGKNSVFMFQIFPALLLGIEGGIMSKNIGTGLAVGVVLAIPGIITLLIYNASLPDPPQWNDEMPKNSIYDLKLYARIPEGINEKQLTELLARYDQKNIIQY